MRKPLCCEAIRAPYEDYNTKQRGGHGISNVLGGLFGRDLHVLKSDAEILGKHAMNIARDMIDVKWFIDSVKDRLKEGIKTFASQREAIQQSGNGARWKRSRQSKKSCKSKKRKIDIFDSHGIRTRTQLRVCQVRV